MSKYLDFPSGYFGPPTFFSSFFENVTMAMNNETWRQTIEEKHNNNNSSSSSNNNNKTKIQMNSFKIKHVSLTSKVN